MDKKKSVRKKIGKLERHSCTNHPPTLLQHFVPHLTIALQALQIPFAAPVAACSVATAALSVVAFAEASFSLLRKDYLEIYSNLFVFKSKKD